VSNKIVTGEYQPHLERALVREVRKHKKADPLSSLMIVAPTNLLSLHLSRLLARELTGHADLHFLTLLDLSRRLGERPLALEGLGPMAPMADRLIFREAVRECLAGGSGSYFIEVSETDGFSEVFLETIGDLKEGCLKPRDLLDALDESHLGPLAEGKIREVVALWKSYETKKKSAGFYDRADLMSEAASNAPGDSRLAATRGIMIYGFYDLNPLQKRLIESCAAVVDTVFFFPYRDEPAFEYARPTLEWVRSLGAEVLDPPREAEERSPDEAKAAEPAVVSAPGEIRECKEICREILRLAGARGSAVVAGPPPVAGVVGASLGIGGDGGRFPVDGLSLNEVGVLLREPAKYAAHLARAFDAAGVEPFITEGLLLGRSRAAAGLIQLMELMESDFGRREVMDFLTFAEIDLGSFLKSGPRDERGRRDGSHAPKVPSPGVEGANPALWDLLSREAGVVSGLDSWERKLSDLLKLRRPSPERGDPRGEGPALREGDRERALRTLIGFIKKMAAWMRSFPSEASPSEFVGRTIVLYEALIASSPERETVVRKMRDLALLDSCAGVLERSFFLRLAGRYLEEARSSVGSFQGKGPTVSGLMAARGLPFKVVVLPGLVEGWFPKPAGRDPILLDRERAALNGAFKASGVEGELGLKAGRHSEERLLFRLSVGAASERVLFTFPRLDPFTGAERMPSTFLLETVESITGTHCEPGSLDGLPFFSRVPLAKLFPDDGVFLDQTEFDLSIAEAAMGEDGSGALSHLKRGGTFFEKAMEAEAHRWGSRRFTRYDGVMDSREAIAALKGRYVGPSGVAAPTSLEDYASCPFAYLMRRILGIKALEDPEELLSMSPADRGGLAHEILERAYREIFSGGERPRPDWQAVLRAEAEEVLSEYRAESDLGLPLLWELDRERLIGDLVASVREDLDGMGGFVPWELELAYGFTGGAQSGGPLRLQVGAERRVPLGGVMDRVDVDEGAGRVKVIDYKTGAGALYGNDSLRGGRTLQLPLYVLGARHLFGSEPAVEGAEYFFVSGGRRGARVRFTSEAVDGRMEDLETVVRTIVDGVEAGIFFAFPGDSCEYCDYSQACGPCGTLFERKRTDERAGAFLKMTEID
jgi:hypothetical protein